MYRDLYERAKCQYRAAKESSARNRRLDCLESLASAADYLTWGLERAADDPDLSEERRASIRSHLEECRRQIAETKRHLRRELIAYD